MKSAARAANKITSMILFVMATTSLIIMFLVVQIDGFVQATLTRYGLEFNAIWTRPYMVIAGIIFAVGWSNIISAIALQLYIYVSWRKVIKREAQSESLMLEQARRLLEGSEQRASSTEQNKETQFSANAGIADRDEARLADVEQPIYDAVVCYFHPETEGKSFKTDFPGRELQSELMRSYREKRISRDEYTEGLIRAFPLRLEQGVSDKILDYLEGWLEEHMTDAEDSLEIVKECRQDRDKRNALWMKICRQYETELRQNVEEKQRHETAPDGKAGEKNNEEPKPTQSTEQTEKGEDQKEPELPIEQEEPAPEPPETDEEIPILAGL